MRDCTRVVRRCVFGLIVGIVVVWIVMLTTITRRRRETVSPDFVEMGGIRAALNRYREINGRFPSGGNREITEALATISGERRFVDIFRDRISGSGELVDPWGRPYLLSASDGVLTFRSPGPDGKWGTSDDQDFGAPSK